MKRGEVWIGNLNSNRGSEIGKIRPVLIIQEDRLTATGLPTIVVLPMTATVRTDASPLRIIISARDKLHQDCQIMVEQPRTLDRQRFGTGPLTTLTKEELAAVEKSILAVIGMS